MLAREAAVVRGLGHGEEAFAREHDLGARELGHATMDLKSEAGHDAYHMSSIVPTAMIFTPCRGGISHNEAEDMTRAEMAPAANVLLRAVLARADR